MIGAFLSWWFDMLVGLLPDTLRPAGGGRGPALLVCVSDGDADSGFTLGLRGWRGVLPLGTLAHGAGRGRVPGAVTRAARSHVIVLRLPSRYLLERQLTLPMAAARDLRGVLGYEIDRLTPFSAADVAWAHRIEATDPAADQVRVGLAMVARAAIRSILASLAQAGLVPQRVEIANGAGVVWSIPLDDTHPAQARAARWRMQAMGLLCGGLAAVTVVVPFVGQAVVEAELDGRIATLRPAVSEVERLRQRVMTEAARGDILASERAQAGNPLAALAALTGVLPDDTFLQEVSFAQRKVTLRGQSGGAARLISLLAADPALRDPAFAAPVIRTEDGRADLFTIRADWVRP